MRNRSNITFAIIIIAILAISGTVTYFGIRDKMSVLVIIVLTAVSAVLSGFILGSIADALGIPLPDWVNTRDEE